MDSLLVSGTRTGSSNDFHSGDRVRPRSGYRRIAASGSADESLFKSFNAGPAKDSFFSDPWAPASKEMKTRPLLWAPCEGGTKHVPSSLRTNTIGTKNVVNITPRKYKLTRHTPSFVDETLFGPRLQEPSFEAPWAEKQPIVKPFFFSPTNYKYNKRTYNKEYEENKAMQVDHSYLMDGRPPSRLSQRSYSTLTRPSTVNPTDNTINRPVWRP